MRDCVFLVADHNMEAMFRGFLAREGAHASLNCGAFAFDPAADLVVDALGNDPGVHERAQEMLRPYQRTHRFAVVALDCAWEGAPAPPVIVDGINQRMRASGWPPDRFAVVAIAPELEAWVWQDSPHVSAALRYRDSRPLRERLHVDGSWPRGASKPPRPKEAMESVLRATRTPRSSAIYAELASRISVRACQDVAFRSLRTALQRWFPEGGA